MRGESESELRRTHWEKVYRERSPGEVSWYQANPARSLDLIAQAGLGLDARILDVGGGASVLVDRLLDLGYQDLTVLDIAEKALAAARDRLGARVSDVRWLAGDVTEMRLEGTYDLWHDRAVFHFLVEPEQRARYLDRLRSATVVGGQVVIATFGLDGPERCSGLPVVRYSATLLSDTLGPEFRLEASVGDEHVTPAGRIQRFVFCRFRRVRAVG